MLLYLAIGFYGNIMFLLLKKNLKIREKSEQSTELIFLLMQTHEDPLSCTSIDCWQALAFFALYAEVCSIIGTGVEVLVLGTTVSYFPLFPLRGSLGLAVSLNNETLNVLHENSDEELYMKTGSRENKLHASLFVPSLVSLHCRSFSLRQSLRTASAMYLFCTCVCLWYAHINVYSHMWGCALVCLYVHTRLSLDFSLVCSLFYWDVISLWSGSLLIWLVQLPSLRPTPRNPVSWLPDFYVVIGGP